tara:strand:- start:1868 stop:2509 length:642 start_codon:yes stop_codon:yes gene_type:complete
MDKKVKFEVIRQFGPSVFKIQIPDEILEKLNVYTEKIINNKKISDQQDHGGALVGDVAQEIRLEKDFMLEIGWIQFLGSCVSKWIEIETKKKVTKFNLKNSWIVRQFKNEYNPTHYHSGHISGAGFLKLPKTFGKHVQEKNVDYKGGNLQLIHGNRLFLCPSLLDIKPKVGDFYFFPHYLMHTVFPFRGSEEERRSISFNATIDEEIFNVYGK